MRAHAIWTGYSQRAGVRWKGRRNVVGTPHTRPRTTHTLHPPSPVHRRTSQRPHRSQPSSHTQTWRRFAVACVTMTVTGHSSNRATSTNVRYSVGRSTRCLATTMTLTAPFRIPMTSTRPMEGGVPRVGYRRLTGKRM